MAATVLDIADPTIVLPEIILIDTSLLLRWRHQNTSVTAFIARLATAALAGQLLIVVPLIVFEEACFKLVQNYYINLNLGHWERDGYKKQPTLLLPFWSKLKQLEQAILHLPAVITGPDDLIVSSVGTTPMHTQLLMNIRQHLLLPKDALIVAEADRLGIRDIATTDRDFDSLSNYTVYRDK